MFQRVSYIKKINKIYTTILTSFARKSKIKKIAYFIEILVFEKIMEKLEVHKENSITFEVL